MPALVLPILSERASVNKKKVSSYSNQATFTEDENPKQETLKAMRLKDTYNHLIVDKKLLAPNASKKFKETPKNERSEFKNQIKFEIEADNQLFGDNSKAALKQIEEVNDYKIEESDSYNDVYHSPAGSVTGSSSLKKHSSLKHKSSMQ